MAAKSCPDRWHPHPACLQLTRKGGTDTRSEGGAPLPRGILKPKPMTATLTEGVGWEIG